MTNEEVLERMGKKEEVAISEPRDEGREICISAEYYSGKKKQRKKLQHQK